jgi:hypothetical protein
MDFIQSDYCCECDGKGYVMLVLKSLSSVIREQCEECERLHAIEARADRLHGEMKGDSYEW